MKRLACVAAVAALVTTGCSSSGSSGSPSARPAPTGSGAAGRTQAPTTTPSKSPSSTTGQSFTYQDDSGYRWRITIQVGEHGPQVHADNCTQGGFDAVPGRTNVAISLTMTNLLTDRSEPVPTSLLLDAGNIDDTLIGPADADGFSCLANLDIGRWFQPGETVALKGIIRNVPDPIGNAVAIVRDGPNGDQVGPVVRLAHG